MKDITERDKKQILKMLHIEGEFSDFSIDTIPVGILRAMAQAIRYGRIQGGVVTDSGTEIEVEDA